MLGVLIVLTDLYHRLRGLGRGANFERAFLSRRQFAREIGRERIRASRRGIPFCIAFIHVECSRHATQTAPTQTAPTRTASTRTAPTRSAQAGRLILRNLRITDEKAMLSRSEFAVMLVDTSQVGGRAVIERLAQLFADKQLRVRMELKVHDPGTGHYQDHSGSDHHEADYSDSHHAGSHHAGSHHAGSLGSRASKEWEPAAKEIVMAGSGSGRREWAEPGHSKDHPSHLQRVVDRFADRRAVHALNYPPVLPAQADEGVSSEDPLVQPSGLSGLLKRSVDVVGAMFGLLVVGPLLVITMAAIRLTSPGGAIFSQTREGLRGKPFTIYKLRTMVVDAESSQQRLRELSHRDGPAFKIKADPRVTPIGRFLRATCIDELPQLVNVLRGDMSLVGPRPLPWHESRACSHWHRRRLDVRPGLTCFWQVNKSSVTSFDEWMRLDLGYVDRGSLWTDVRLIYQTVSVALTGRGSH